MCISIVTESSVGQSSEGTPAKDERRLVRELLSPHPSLRLSGSAALCWGDHIPALLSLKVFCFPKVLRLRVKDKTTARSSCLPEDIVIRLKNCRRIKR